MTEEQQTWEAQEPGKKQESGKRERCDLRVWVPWLKRKVIYARLVAFHLWPPGFSWEEFNKPVPGMKPHAHVRTLSWARAV